MPENNQTDTQANENTESQNKDNESLTGDSNTSGSSYTDSSDSSSAASSDTHWSASLGEGVGDQLKDFTSAEDAVKAALRGKDYNPVSKPEDMSFTLENATPEQETLLKDFKDFCVSSKLTAEQAKAVVEWNAGVAQKARDAAFEEGSTALKGIWGLNYEKNVNSALKVVSLLDKRLDGELSKALEVSGGNNNPTVIRALHEISKLISEDSLGGSKSGAGEEKPKSTADFLKDEVFGGK